MGLILAIDVLDRHKLLQLSVLGVRFRNLAVVLSADQPHRPHSQPSSSCIQKFSLNIPHLLTADPVLGVPGLHLYFSSLLPPPLEISRSTSMGDH